MKLDPAIMKELRAVIVDACFSRLVAESGAGNELPRCAGCNAPFRPAVPTADRCVRCAIERKRTA